MADALFSKLRTQLDIELRDADNFTLEVAEKDEALRSAIEDDPNCYKTVIDQSNIIVAALPSYSTPFDRTLDVGYDAAGDGYITRLSPSLWEQIDDTIWLSRDTLNCLPPGKVLYLYGAERLTKNDLIPQQLRAYIMANAVIKCVDMLLESKINRFLRNKTTVAEMQQVRNNKLQLLAKLERTLRRPRPMAF